MIIDGRIFYHDTDAGGVVYYARYLNHLEEGRVLYFADKGVDTAEFMKNGIIFPVVHLEVDYKAPARYGDAIKVHTTVESLGNASINFAQSITRGDTTLINAKIVCACVNSSLKPQRIPEDIRAKL